MRLQYQTPRRWVPTHELIQSDATWRGSSTEFVVYVMVEPLTKSQTKDWTAEIVPSTPRLIEPKGPFPGTQSPSSLLSRVPQRAPKKEHKSLCPKEGRRESKRKQTQTETKTINSQIPRRARAAISTGFWVKHGASEYSKRSPKRTVPSPRRCLPYAGRSMASRLPAHSRCLAGIGFCHFLAFWVLDRFHLLDWEKWLRGLCDLQL